MIVCTMWAFTQTLGEFALTVLQVFYLSYVTFYLQKFVNIELMQRPNVGIIRKGESMCDSCKKKDATEKRIFKQCRHSYCERCFLRQCVDLCRCVHCAVVHLNCRLCSKASCN